MRKEDEMKRKCPKCGKSDMRVWDEMNGKMFLECKSCHWTSKDLPWTKKAKKEWNRLNPGWRDHRKSQYRIAVQEQLIYTVVHPVGSFLLEKRLQSIASAVDRSSTGKKR